MIVLIADVTVVAVAAAAAAAIVVMTVVVVAVVIVVLSVRRGILERGKEISTLEGISF